MLDKKDYEEIAHLMRVIVESDITPKLNLLAEGQQTIIDKQIPYEDIEALETRVDALEAVLKKLNRDIAALKKAN